MIEKLDENYVATHSFESYNHGGFGARVDRDLIDYDVLLPDFTRFFSSSSKNDLTWFDSGAGNGSAILDVFEPREGVFKKHYHEYNLFQTPIIEKYVGRIVGSSKHYLEGVEKLLNYSDKVDFFIGDSQEVLKSIGKVDVISDLFGAYVYSEDKLNVLKTFYDSLNVGGQAHIILSRSFRFPFALTDTAFLESYACQVMPFSFSLKKDDCLILKINKYSDEDLNPELFSGIRLMSGVTGKDVPYFSDII